MNDTIDFQRFKKYKEIDTKYVWHCQRRLTSECEYYICRGTECRNYLCNRDCASKSYKQGEC